MMKFVFPLLATLFLTLTPSWSDEIEILNGLVTSSNVDITAGDGSLLSERLQVGDQVFIIINPADERKGWVRISKSSDDLDGIGWVEERHVRSFSRYKVVSRPGKGKSPAKVSRNRPAPMNRTSKNLSKVAVAPFVFSKSSDAMGQKAFKAFSKAVEDSGSFTLASAPSRMDSESKASLRLIGKKMNLRGIFTGKLSDPIGGGRLLQVKFYSVEKDDFVVEKVKRIPVNKDPRPIVQGLVSEILETF